jgi:hypothetical protein
VQQVTLNQQRLSSNLKKVDAAGCTNKRQRKKYYPLSPNFIIAFNHSRLNLPFGRFFMADPFIRSSRPYFSKSDIEKILQEIKLVLMDGN